MSLFGIESVAYLDNVAVAVGDFGDRCGVTVGSTLDSVFFSFVDEVVAFFVFAGAVNDKCDFVGGI